MPPADARKQASERQHGDFGERAAPRPSHPVRIALSALVVCALSACDRSPPPAPKAAPQATPDRTLVAPPEPSASASAEVAAPPEPRGPRPVDPARLTALEREASETQSSALVVIQHGKVVSDVSRGAAEPIQTMSITKSVLALLIGCLLDRKKLTLDQPVHELFDVWQRERQKQVTIRHLLTHSSGLEEGKRTYDIYASRDFIAHALRKPLLHEPGTHYEYGNRASNLLSGVIARAAGQRTDLFARECLFEPLGITRWEWSRDRAGNAHGLAGLHLTARDLARIGELVLGDGQWRGRRVLSAEAVRLTREPARVQPDGKRLAHLWWLLPAWTRRTLDPPTLARWKEAGVSEKLVKQVEPLVGKRFDSALEFVKALRTATGDPELRQLEAEVYERKLADSAVELGPIVGSYAAGSLGQYLIVVPEHALVAVRLRKSPRPRPKRETFELSFPDFPARVLGLVEGG